MKKKPLKKALFLKVSFLLFLIFLFRSFKKFTCIIKFDVLPKICYSNAYWMTRHIRRQKQLWKWPPWQLMIHRQWFGLYFCAEGLIKHLNSAMNREFHTSLQLKKSLTSFTKKFSMLPTYFRHGATFSLGLI